MSNIHTKLIEIIRKMQFACAQRIGSDTERQALEAAMTALEWAAEMTSGEPLTLEQLREMDGPVWVACKPIRGGNGYWCLCRYGHITTPGGTFFEVGEIPHWVFYRFPPEGEDA